MACTKVVSGATGPAGSTTHATEADCLKKCGEGACCTGTTCAVTPKCKCTGTGQVFKGVGTTCTPDPCAGGGGGGGGGGGDAAYGRCCGPDTINTPHLGQRLKCRPVSSSAGGLGGFSTAAECVAFGGTYTPLQVCSASSDNGPNGCATGRTANPLP
jgi:hypothetical protein